MNYSAFKFNAKLLFSETDRSRTMRPKECVRKVVNDLVFHISLQLIDSFLLLLIHEKSPIPIARSLMLMEPELSGTGRMMSIIDKEIKLQLYPISG